MSDIDEPTPTPDPRRRATRDSEGGVLNMNLRLNERNMRWTVGIILAAVTGVSTYSAVKVHSTADKVERTDDVADEAKRSADATFGLSSERDQTQAALMTSVLEAWREVARYTKRCLSAADRRELQERMAELEKRAAPLVQKIQQPIPATPEAAAAAVAAPPAKPDQ